MAGRIPQSFIDELISRADLVELVGERVTLKKAGKDYTACCPFHQEKTPSFSVVPAKQFYHCFGCGANGNALSFLMEYDRLDFVDAVESLASRYAMTVPYEGGSHSEDAEHRALYALMSEASRWFQNQLRAGGEAEAAIDYLKKRGLTGAIAKQFELGYAPSGWTRLVDELGNSPPATAQLLAAGLAKQNETGRVYDLYRERIIFPIRDRRGRVVGFGGRVLDTAKSDGSGAGPKYLNSPETPIFHKSREVYGLYEAHQANRQLRQLMVVEGYMDVIALAQAGISYAVATLGTATTSDHLDLLFKQVSRLVFCFDGDKAGRKAANKALDVVLDKLGDEREVRFLFLPEGEDPDSLVRAEGKQRFEERLANAMPLIEFVIERVAEEHGCSPQHLSVPAGNAAKEMALRIPGKLHRDVLFQLQRERMGLNSFKKKPWGKPVPEPLPRAPVLDFIERALLILVQHPHLATRLPLRALQSELDALQAERLPFFKALLELLSRSPVSSSEALRAQWGDRPDQDYLQWLAARDLLLGAEALENELSTIITALRERASLALVSQLQAKLQSSGPNALTPQEKEQLKSLLLTRRAPSQTPP